MTPFVQSRGGHLASACVAIFWPLAYFLVYLPLFVGLEAWHFLPACVWLLMLTYVLLLIHLGRHSSLLARLSTIAGAPLLAFLFVAIASLKSFPGFMKSGDEPWLYAGSTAIALGLVSTVVLLVAWGLREDCQGEDLADARE